MWKPLKPLKQFEKFCRTNHRQIPQKFEKENQMTRHRPPQHYRKQSIRTVTHSSYQDPSDQSESELSDEYLCSLTMLFDSVSVSQVSISKQKADFHGSDENVGYPIWVAKFATYLATLGNHRPKYFSGQFRVGYFILLRMMSTLIPRQTRTDIKVGPDVLSVGIFWKIQTFWVETLP